MHRATLPRFFGAVLAACSLIWGAELAFPKGIASGFALAAVLGLGLWIVRPGWHLRPGPVTGHWLSLFALLLASAAGAAWFLNFFKIPTPYDFTTFDLGTAMPAIALITGIEELLFRQVMYRWLERRGVSYRMIIAATALAFGWAHLGPLFIGSPIGATFHILQSAYMVWIGILLGQIRRATQSWTMPWLGHLGYNAIVLRLLSIA